MKNITFKLLFCLLFATFVNAQTANNDELQICFLGGPSFIRPLYNDTVPSGSIVIASLDLDQSLSGVQSSVIINGIEFYADVYGEVTWNPVGIGSGQICPIYYTFSDDLGNISNVGLIRIYFDPAVFLNDDLFNNYSPGNTTLESVLTNDSVFGCSGGYCLSNPIFMTSYPGFTLNTDGTITIDSGVIEGLYTMYYEIIFGNCAVSDGKITINVTPEIKLNILGTYLDYNSDGYTSVGDIISYQYSINNASLTDMNSVGLTSPTFGILGSTIPVLNAGLTDNTTFSGQYLITQNDINTGAVIPKIATASGTSSFGTSSITKSVSNSLSISNGIKLNAFFDTNGNGVQNVGEINLNFGQFNYEINSDGIIHNITSSTGFSYLYESNPATVYNLSYTLDPAFATYYTLSTASYPIVTVAAGSGIVTYNFPIVAGTLFNDLAVNLMPNGAPPRPGFTYKNKIKYTNYSNQTITAGTVIFNCGSAVSILSTLPAATFTATNFTYNFINLLPFESRYIDVTMQVPVIPTISLGDLVANTVSITPNAGDIHPLDNTSNLTQTIVGSYDPNDKVENHSKEILYSSFTTNDYLTYTIQFENTGTANAVNVRVNDVLDSQLNKASIKVIDASHPYILDRIGNNLNFKFEAIDLPPSVSGTNIGKGYVVFQVKPNSGFAIGDIIPNTANIYFDFNPAIVTNTFQTKFVSTLAVGNFDSSSIQLFPNPVKDILNINSKSTILSTEIFDINGRKIQTTSQNNNEVILNIENLHSGIYLLKVTTDDGTSIQKIIKK